MQRTPPRRASPHGGSARPASSLAWSLRRTAFSIRSPTTTAPRTKSPYRNPPWALAQRANSGIIGHAAHQALRADPVPRPSLARSISAMRTAAPSRVKMCGRACQCAEPTAMASTKVSMATIGVTPRRSRVRNTSAYVAARSPPVSTARPPRPPARTLSPVRTSLSHSYGTKGAPALVNEKGPGRRGRNGEWSRQRGCAGLGRRPATTSDGRGRAAVRPRVRRQPPPGGRRRTNVVVCSPAGRRT